MYFTELTKYWFLFYEIAQNKVSTGIFKYPNFEPIDLARATDFAKAIHFAWPCDDQINRMDGVSYRWVNDS